MHLTAFTSLSVIFVPEAAQPPFFPYNSYIHTHDASFLHADVRD